VEGLSSNTICLRTCRLRDSASEHVSKSSQIRAQFLGSQDKKNAPQKPLKIT
jgi:hypothetical protein